MELIGPHVRLKREPPVSVDASTGDGSHPLRETTEAMLSNGGTGGVLKLQRRTGERSGPQVSPRASYR